MIGMNFNQLYKKNAIQYLDSTDWSTLIPGMTEIWKEDKHVTWCNDIEVVEDQKHLEA